MTGEDNDTVARRLEPWAWEAVAFSLHFGAGMMRQSADQGIVSDPEETRRLADDLVLLARDLELQDD